ncbi:MAG: hypothetical protein WEC33_00585, partial [Dehalococcoidia bacterium]
MPGSNPYLSNVFFGYRGSADNDAARARQLEDNLSRALCIVLDQLRGNAIALRPLLAALGLPVTVPEGDFSVVLQPQQPSWDPAEARKGGYIVIHSGLTGEAAPAIEAKRVGEGRPDFIIEHRSGTFVIEAELAGRPDHDQMLRIADRFPLSEGPGEYLETTW